MITFSKIVRDAKLTLGVGLCLACHTDVSHRAPCYTFPIPAVMILQQWTEK